MQQRQLVGHLAAQAIAQEIAEQVVQPERRLGAVEHRDEEAAPLDLLEPFGGARIGGDRGAAAGRELVEDRAAQQEAAQRQRQLAEDFVQQIVEDVAVVDGVGDQRLCFVARADAVDREAESDRPAWVRWKRRWLVASWSTARRRRARAATRAPRRA
jgi:hypothetical protein